MRRTRDAVAGQVVPGRGRGPSALACRGARRRRGTPRRPGRGGRGTASLTPPHPRPAAPGAQQADPRFDAATTGRRRRRGRPREVTGAARRQQCPRKPASRRQWLSDHRYLAHK